jgi:hypothetical protein
MFAITDRHGVQVAEADTFVAAMRLVDYHQHTERHNAPFRALPVKAPAAKPAKPSGLFGRFFAFFGITE